MMRKPGWIVGAALVLSLSTGIRAQEEPPPAEGETPPPAEESSEARESWFKRTFGDKFALYVEFAASSSEFEDLDLSVATTGDLVSRNRFTIDDAFGGTGTIGWRLPNDRGRYLVTFEGFKEEGFDFEGLGFFRFIPLDPNANPTQPLLWWTVRMNDSGRLDSSRTPPIWSAATDTNGNGRADVDEVTYGGSDLTFSTSTPRNFRNRTQTWDLYYSREWGGRRVRGAWTVGGRYFLYEGTMPVAAWLGDGGTSAGSQYTDGEVIRLIPMTQDTTGWGPRGSGEVQYHFARGRMTVFARATAALLFQTMRVDSGDFSTFVRDQATGTLLAPARLSLDLDKTVWHLIGEAGAKIRLVPGGFLVVSYSYRGYLDMILTPTQIAIPATSVQINQGTIGLYTSRDLRVRSVSAGFSYQF